VLLQLALGSAWRPGPRDVSADGLRRHPMVASLTWRGDEASERLGG